MHFIIEHFINVMRSFGIEMVVRYNKMGNFYEILFHNLPVELDMHLVKTHYMEYVGKKITLLNPGSKKDDRVKEEEIFADHHIAVPIEMGHESYIKVVLNEDDYARKINFIHREVSDYFRNLPLNKWSHLPKLNMV